MAEDIEKDHICKDVLERLQIIESAFTKDELGMTDYSGHRKYHKDQISAQERIEESKHKIISNITSWAAIGILTIVGGAVVQYLIMLKR